MTDIWVTSDTHFGHKNIIKFCNRPFDDPDAMNQYMINEWNKKVKPDDIVYHLGDVALGKIADTLPLVAQLNGRKSLVPGNHDRCFPTNKDYNTRWWDEYKQYFAIQPLFSNIMLPKRNKLIVGLCHFPRSGDSHADDRFDKYRPRTWDGPLIHGHVHDQWVIKGDQFNAGVDVNEFEPVMLDNALDILGY